jgi:energy-coupling factor transporter ATP-binding protein EcfA2
MLTHTAGKKIPLKIPSRLGHEGWKLVKHGSMAAPVAGSAAALMGHPELGLAAAALGSLTHFYAKMKLPRHLFTISEGEPYVWFGTDRHELDIRIPVSELTRHMLLLGTTGSGKTTLLRLLVHTLLKQGGGVTFVDGKADVADMYAVFYSLVADADRIEDLMVLNFLNPAQSHTFNPFKYGDADFLSEVLAGLLPGMSGDGEYWQGRAKIMMRSLMTVLVWLRDNRDYPLDIGTIRDGLALRKIAHLAATEEIPLDDADGRMVRSRLMAYMDELGPNWRMILQGGGTPQAQQALKAVTEQHGYAIQQWSEPLDLLSGRYRQIFMSEAKASDIDMQDVVTNSRCLYVLLPSLELSPTTLKGLGRMILSTFKIAFTSALGKDVIGDFGQVRKEIYSRRPKPPHLLIADEYGSYAVEGFDIVLAQARSLGLGVVISVQELASLFKANEQEAKRLIGNTNIKVALKIEDPDTSKYIVERAGEDWVLVPGAREHRGPFSTSLGNVDGAFQYQKQSRIDGIDTVHLKPGQGYLIIGSELRKFRYPHIKGKDPDRMVLWAYTAKEPPPLPGQESGLPQEDEIANLMRMIGLNRDSAEFLQGMKLEYGYSALDIALMDTLPHGTEEDIYEARQSYKNFDEFKKVLLAMGVKPAHARAIIEVMRRRRKYMQFRNGLIREMQGSSRFQSELNEAAPGAWAFVKEAL